MLTGWMSRIVALVLSIYENSWTRNRGTDDNILLLLLIFMLFVLYLFPNNHARRIRRMLMMVT